MRTAREQRITSTASIQHSDYFEPIEPLQISSTPLHRREQEALALVLGAVIFGLVSFGGFLTEILPELKYNLLVSGSLGLSAACLTLAVAALQARRS